MVVSNAAANPSIDTILETQESVLDKLWEINVKAAVLLLKVFLSTESFRFMNQNVIVGHAVVVVADKNTHHAL